MGKTYIFLIDSIYILYTIYPLIINKSPSKRYAISIPYPSFLKGEEREEAT
jgi:hypothetical protein